jgi:hypothetical protein
VLVAFSPFVPMLAGLCRGEHAQQRSRYGLAMPFVTDIVGPQRPVRRWPPLVPGGLRRTSTIDTHPSGAGESVVDLRARDFSTDVLGEVRVHAHLTDRVIDDIDPGLERLVGSRVGPGFRSTVGRLFPGGSTGSSSWLDDV